MRLSRHPPRQRHAPTAPEHGHAVSPSPVLVIACGLLSLICLAFTCVLALPGDPEHWSGGLESAAQQPAILIPVAVVLLAAGLWSVRSWNFRKHLIAPGPIGLVLVQDAITETGLDAPLPTVPPVTPELEPARDPVSGYGVSPLASPPLLAVGMYLRQRLSDLRLSVPMAVPGSGTTTDFVELLESTKIDVKQPLAVLGRIAKIVSPTHCYQVKATLLSRVQAPRHGICVETVVLPRRLTTFGTYWGTSWENAADQAAYGVAAHIVPMTRHSHEGPWSHWRNKPLDAALFHCYVQARQLGAERRYEEALDRFYEALRLDPHNMQIRFELGVAQEKLALHLDALLTYQSIIRDESVPFNASKRPGRWTFERVRLMTRYRFAIGLGRGDRLAAQWLPVASDARRSRRTIELQQVRQRLRPVLIERFGDERWTAADRQLLGGPDASCESVLSEEDTDDTPRRVWKGRIHLAFLLMAREEIDVLISEYRGIKIERLDTGLTSISLEFLRAWADLRTERARAALGDGLAKRKLNSVDDIHDRWTTVPAARGGRTLLQRLERSREFVDHYNAACTYAINLDQIENLREPSVASEELVKAQLALRSEAIKELHRAVAFASSTEVSQEWDWIVSEDPDLAALRPHEEFRRFETYHFPSTAPAPVRPRDTVVLESNRYSARLIRECARRLEQQWHMREHAPQIDVHTALEWWGTEKQAWDLAKALASHHRHWPTRLAIIKAMHVFLDEEEMPVFFVPHPRYSELPLSVSQASIEEAAKEAVTLGNRRLFQLERELKRVDDVTGGPGFDAWRAYFARRDEMGEPLAPEQVASICVNRAATWASLAQWFEIPVHADERLQNARSEFRAKLQSLDTDAGRPPSPTAD